MGNSITLIYQLYRNIKPSCATLKPYIQANLKLERCLILKETCGYKAYVSKIRFGPHLLLALCCVYYVHCMLFVVGLVSRTRFRKLGGSTYVRPH
jgi:hypothetical protein